MRAAPRGNLDRSLRALMRPRCVVATAGCEGGGGDVVEFEVLPPYGSSVNQDAQQSFTAIKELLEQSFPDNADDVHECVCRGRDPVTGERRCDDNTYEPCLTACLWLGGQVAAAAVLRLNLPPPPSASSSSSSASGGGGGAGADGGAHLQVVFLATAPWLRRRGLGLLLMQCIMRTAVEQGHKYMMALVSGEADAERFWAHVGFRKAPPRAADTALHGTRPQPAHAEVPPPPPALQQALQLCRAQSLFCSVSVWYAGVAPHEQQQGEGEEEDEEEDEVHLMQGPAEHTAAGSATAAAAQQPHSEPHLLGPPAQQASPQQQQLMTPGQHEPERRPHALQTTPLCGRPPEQQRPEQTQQGQQQQAGSNQHRQQRRRQARGWKPIGAAGSGRGAADAVGCVARHGAMVHSRGTASECAVAGAAAGSSAGRDNPGGNEADNNQSRERSGGSAAGSDGSQQQLVAAEQQQVPAVEGTSALGDASDVFHIYVKGKAGFGLSKTASRAAFPAAVQALAEAVREKQAAEAGPASCSEPITLHHHCRAGEVREYTGARLTQGVTKYSISGAGPLRRELSATRQTRQQLRVLPCGRVLMEAAAAAGAQAMKAAAAAAAAEPLAAGLGHGRLQQRQRTAQKVRQQLQQQGEETDASDQVSEEESDQEESSAGEAAASKPPPAIRRLQGNIVVPIREIDMRPIYVPVPLMVQLVGEAAARNDATGPFLLHDAVSDAPISSKAILQPRVKRVRELAWEMKGMREWLRARHARDDDDVTLSWQAPAHAGGDGGGDPGPPPLYVGYARRNGGRGPLTGACGGGGESAAAEVGVAQHQHQHKHHQEQQQKEQEQLQASAKPEQYFVEISAGTAGGALLYVRLDIVERLLGRAASRSGGGGGARVPLYDSATRAPILGARLHFRLKKFNSAGGDVTWHPSWFAPGLQYWLRAHNAAEGDQVAFSSEPVAAATGAGAGAVEPQAAGAAGGGGGGNGDGGAAAPYVPPRVYLEYRRQQESSCGADPQGGAGAGAVEAAAGEGGGPVPMEAAPVTEKAGGCSRAAAAAGAGAAALGKRVAAAPAAVAAETGQGSVQRPCKRAVTPAALMVQPPQPVEMPRLAEQWSHERPCPASAGGQEQQLAKRPRAPPPPQQPTPQQPTRSNGAANTLAAAGKDAHGTAPAEAAAAAAAPQPPAPAKATEALGQTEVPGPADLAGGAAAASASASPFVQVPVTIQQQHQQQPMDTVLAEHCPMVAQLLAGTSEQEARDGRPGQQVLPMQALLQFARNADWQMETEFEKVATGHAQCFAFEATIRLQSGAGAGGNGGATITATGKAAADKETAKQLAAAACLQLLRVRLEDLGPQQRPPQPQQQPQLQAPALGLGGAALHHNSCTNSCGRDPAAALTSSPAPAARGVVPASHEVQPATAVAEVAKVPLPMQPQPQQQQQQQQQQTPQPQQDGRAHVVGAAVANAGAAPSFDAAASQAAVTPPPVAPAHEHAAVDADGRGSCSRATAAAFDAAAVGASGSAQPHEGGTAKEGQPAVGAAGCGGDNERQAAAREAVPPPVSEAQNAPPPSVPPSAAAAPGAVGARVGMVAAPQQPQQPLSAVAQGPLPQQYDHPCYHAQPQPYYTMAQPAWPAVQQGHMGLQYVPQPHQQQHHQQQHQQHHQHQHPQQYQYQPQCQLTPGWSANAGAPYGPYSMPPQQQQQHQGSAAGSAPSAPPPAPPQSMPPPGGYPTGYYWPPPPMPMPGYGGPYAAAYPQQQQPPQPGGWGPPPPAGAQWPPGSWPLPYSAASYPLPSQQQQQQQQPPQPQPGQPAPQ